MFKIGTSTFGNDISEDFIASIKAAGLNAIEISYGNYNDYKCFDFNNVKVLSDKHGVDLWSLHLPFGPFEEIDPSSLDKNVRSFTFDYFIELIKKGADIGIDKFVAHPSGEPISDEMRRDRLEASAEFFNKLAEASQKCGAIIALEDLPRTCIGRNSEEIGYLLSANDKLRVCFDTNHLLKESISDFIEKIGAKIITVHISDYDFVNERHWLPGEGDIDWQELSDKLIKSGYSGVWLYELGLKAPNSIVRRDMTYSDLYNNAFEIFNGKKPTAIGKRIENLGFWGPV